MDRMNEAVESPLGNLVLDFVHSFLYQNNTTFRLVISLRRNKSPIRRWKSRRELIVRGTKSRDGEKAEDPYCATPSHAIAMHCIALLCVEE